MLANGTRISNQSQAVLFSQIDSLECQAVFKLITVLSALRTQVFSHTDVNMRLKVVELVTTLVANYALLLIYVGDM